MSGDPPSRGGANPEDEGMNMAPLEAVGMTKVPLLARAEEVEETSEVLEVDGVAGPAGDGAAVDMSLGLGVALDFTASCQNDRVGPCGTAGMGSLAGPWIVGTACAGVGKRERPRFGSEMYAEIRDGRDR
jgi:hypothetical protein